MGRARRGEAEQARRAAELYPGQMRSNQLSRHVAEQMPTLK